MRMTKPCGLLVLAFLLPSACGGSGDETEAPPGQLTVALQASPGEGVAPLTVEFSPTVIGAQGALDYAWSFGDGADASSDPSPSHRYETGGVFSVVLLVEDAAGAQGVGTAEVVVQADSEPSPSVSAAPLEGFAPLAVRFACAATAGNAPLAYRWDFGDGQGADAAEPWHSYAAAGQYTATCTVTDADGDSAQGSVEIRVVAADAAPEPAVTVVDGACSIPGRTRVQLDASASSDPDGDVLAFEWVFVRIPADSQARFNNPAIANPTFVPDVGGTYEMRVFVSDGQQQRASEVLSIEASDQVGALQLIGGDGQVGVAGTPMPESLDLAVTNRCGSPLPQAELSWHGTNAQLSQAVTLTDEYGYGMNSAAFGTRQGPATVSVHAGSESLVFTFEVEAGQAAYVLMELVQPAPVDEAATIQLQVTDMHLNPLDSPDLSLDLVLLAEEEVSPGQEPYFSDTGTDALSGVETSGGRYSTQVQSPAAVPVRVEMSPQPLADGTQLEGIGRILLFGDDMESWDHWQREGDSQWQVGTPSVGPAAAHSGSRVLGTRLDGPFVVADEDPVALCAGSIQWPGLPLRAVSLEFWHWYDFGGDERPCSPAVGLVTKGGDEVLFPAGGYPGPAACGETVVGGDALGYGAASEGWELAAFDVSAVFDGQNGTLQKDAGFAFTLSAPDYPDARPGPGWFIDDLRLTGLAGAGRIPFVAGEPEGIRAEILRDGVASIADQCAVEALLELTPVDQYGNPVLRPDLLLEFSPGQGMELAEVVVGERVSESAGTYSLRLSKAPGEEPALLLSLRGDSPGELQSTALLAGLPASSTAIPVSFAAPPPGDCCVNAIPVAWNPDFAAGEASIPQVCDLHSNGEAQVCPSSSHADMAFAFQVPTDGYWILDTYHESGWPDLDTELWRLSGEGLCPGEPVASEAGAICEGSYWMGQLYSAESYVLIVQNTDGICGRVDFAFYPGRNP